MQVNFHDRFDAHGGDFGTRGVILGDSAYPNLEWLLTPVAHPKDADEVRSVLIEAVSRDHFVFCFPVY